MQLGPVPWARTMVKSGNEDCNYCLWTQRESLWSYSSLRRTSTIFKNASARRGSLASENDCVRHRRQPNELVTFLLIEKERTACRNAGNRLLHDYHLRECGRDVLCTRYAPGSDKCTSAKVSVAAYGECRKTCIGMVASFPDCIAAKRCWCCFCHLWHCYCCVEHVSHSTLLFVLPHNPTGCSLIRFFVCFVLLTYVFLVETDSLLPFVVNLGETSK